MEIFPSLNFEQEAIALNSVLVSFNHLSLLKKNVPEKFGGIYLQCRKINSLLLRALYLDDARERLVPKGFS